MQLAGLSPDSGLVNAVFAAYVNSPEDAHKIKSTRPSVKSRKAIDIDPLMHASGLISFTSSSLKASPAAMYLTDLMHSALSWTSSSSSYKDGNKRLQADSMNSSATSRPSFSHLRNKVTTTNNYRPHHSQSSTSSTQRKCKPTNGEEEDDDSLSSKVDLEPRQSLLLTSKNDCDESQPSTSESPKVFIKNSSLAELYSHRQRALATNSRSIRRALDICSASFPSSIFPPPDLSSFASNMIEAFHQSAIVSEISEQVIEVMASAEWQGQFTPFRSSIQTEKGHGDEQTRRNENKTISSLACNTTKDDNMLLDEKEAAVPSSFSPNGYESFRSIFGDKFEIITDGATICPLGHALNALDVVEGFSNVNEDDYTTRCPHCASESSSRFFSSFFVAGLIHDKNHLKKRDDEEVSSSSLSRLTVTRLPAQALLKEILTTLELPSTYLTSATYVLNASQAYQIALMMKGVEDPFPSSFFWNLMVLFQETNLPYRFIISLIHALGII